MNEDEDSKENTTSHTSALSSRSDPPSLHEKQLNRKSWKYKQTVGIELNSTGEISHVDGRHQMED